MAGLGIVESVFVIAMVISVIWVFFDAPKYGINKYLVALAVLFLVYPVGFIDYLAFSRMRKKLI